MRTHEAGDAYAQIDKKGGSAVPKEPPWIRHCDGFIQLDIMYLPNCQGSNGSCEMLHVPFLLQVTGNNTVHISLYVLVTAIHTKPGSCIIE